MAAIPTETFNFVLGDITFYVDREKMEMYPGVSAEIVTIDFEIFEKSSEAGVCLNKDPFADSL